MFANTIHEQYQPHVQHRVEYARTILLGELSVNGVPVVSWSRETNGVDRFSKDLNPWLKRGENKLALWCWWPPGRPFATGQASIEINLRQKIGSADWTRRPLLVWPSDGFPEYYGTTVEKSFKTPDAPQTRLWQDAGVLARSEQTKLEALALAERIHLLFALGEVDPILEIMQYRTRELALVEGFTLDQATATIRGYLNVTRDRAEFSAGRFNANEMQVDFIGDDRLLWIRRGGIKPAISITDKGGEKVMDFNLYLAKIGGHWVWVR